MSKLSTRANTAGATSNRQNSFSKCTNIATTIIFTCINTSYGHYIMIRSRSRISEASNEDYESDVSYDESKENSRDNSANSNASDVSKGSAVSKASAASNASEVSNDLSASKVQEQHITRKLHKSQMEDQTIRQRRPLLSRKHQKHWVVQAGLRQQQSFQRDQQQQSQEQAAIMRSPTITATITVEATMRGRAMGL